MSGSLQQGSSVGIERESVSEVLRTKFLDMAFLVVRLGDFRSVVNNLIQARLAQGAVINPCSFWFCEDLDGGDWTGFQART